MSPEDEVAVLSLILYAARLTSLIRSIQFKRRLPSSTAAKSIRPRLENEDDAKDEETSIVKPDLRLPAKKMVSTNRTSETSRAEEQVTQVYHSNREIVPQKYAGDATATLEIDTEVGRDARSILERNILLNETGVLDDEPNIYRGQAAYKNYVKKDMSQVGSNKFTGTQGPLRAPAFVRTTARFDYQPDICKDYKETGFCGYGDQCKCVSIFVLLTKA